MITSNTISESNTGRPGTKHCLEEDQSGCNSIFSGRYWLLESQFVFSKIQYLHISRFIFTPFTLLHFFTEDNPSSVFSSHSQESQRLQPVPGIAVKPKMITETAESFRTETKNPKPLTHNERAA